MIVRLEKTQVTDMLVHDSVKASFGGAAPGDFYRYDFMYAGYDEESLPLGFVLCREISAEEVQFSYGGVTSKGRGFSALKHFSDFLGEMALRYKYATALVENKNFPMLKIYIALGFEIVGVRQNPTGRIFVEFFKKLKEN